MMHRSKDVPQIKLHGIDLRHCKTDKIKSIHFYSFFNVLIQFLFRNDTKVIFFGHFVTETYFSLFAFEFTFKGLQCNLKF